MWGGGGGKLDDRKRSQDGGEAIRTVTSGTWRSLVETTSGKGKLGSMERHPRGRAKMKRHMQDPDKARRQQVVARGSSEVWRGTVHR